VSEDGHRRGLLAPQVAGSLLLSRLLGRAVVDAGGEDFGRLGDVIVRLAGAGYPQVVGLVVDTARGRVFVGLDSLGALDHDPLQLTRPRASLHHPKGFERREGEVLLGAEILHHRLIEVAAARFVRAYDVLIVGGEDGWTVRGIVTRRRRRLRRRDEDSELDILHWRRFEPLVGHVASARLRRVPRPLRRLKPAQIADLIEQASKEEGQELLDFVHEDPELEADVFEEVDPALQVRLLAERNDTEVAAVLARMQADDAADAIAELPQERRLAIIELLPEDRCSKVLALLGFNSGTAGGLMVPDCIALPASSTVAEALRVLRDTPNVEGVVTTTVYFVDEDGRLTGASPLASLVRADPDTSTDLFAETAPAHVHPDADLVELALVMSDYNLVLLPVTDVDHHLLGVVTVDDVLEATIPPDWRRRGSGSHPIAGPPRSSEERAL